MLKNYLMVFFVSMVPVIELRGAIPIGLGMGLPALPTYLVCVLGNMLPVPFIYLFARKFLIWGYHKPVIGPVCKFFITKGEKGGRKLEEKAGKGLTVALLLFVGIPLPGTGAWTGTLAASILDMKFKDVLIACMGGVLLAGIIMGLASAGVLGAASSLFEISPSRALPRQLPWQGSQVLPRLLEEVASSDSDDDGEVSYRSRLPKAGKSALSVLQ